VIRTVLHDSASQEGFSTIDEIATFRRPELAAKSTSLTRILKELAIRARDVLLTQAIATRKCLDHRCADDLPFCSRA